jgi:hypothetical protein
MEDDTTPSLMLMYPLDFSEIKPLFCLTLLLEHCTKGDRPRSCRVLSPSVGTAHQLVCCKIIFLDL